MAKTKNVSNLNEKRYFLGNEVPKMLIMNTNMNKNRNYLLNSQIER